MMVVRLNRGESDDDVDDREGTGGRIVATTIPEMARGRNRDNGTARTSMMVMADAGDGRCWLNREEERKRCCC